MKSSARRLAAAVLVGVVVASCAVAGPALAASSGTISGVASSNGITDLTGVVVKLYSGSTQVSSVSTDAHGQFAFPSVGFGRYRVCFDGSALRRPQAPIGLALECYDDSLTLADATTVQVTTTNSPFLVPTLTPAAILTGSVHDTAGNPLAGATVTAGRYILRTGADGTYRARVAAMFTDICVDGSTLAGPTSQVGYLDACTQNGDTVSVPAGVTTTADITMAPAAAISGHVTDQSGLPLAGVTVDGSGGRRGSQAVTGADGSYRLAQLAGQDSVSVHFQGAGASGGGSSTGYLSGCYGQGRSCLHAPTTDGVDTTGVDGVLRWAGGASGRVTDRHGVGIGNVTVDVELDTDGSSTTTAPDGRWSITGLTPGRATACFRSYGHAVGADPDGYVDACWPDKPPSQGSSLTIPGGRFRAGVNAQLTGNGGVAGRVVTTGGTPVHNAEVQLTGADSSFDAGYTDADGRFRVGQLSPGTYHVCLEPFNNPGLAPRCLPGTAAVTEAATTTLPDAVMRPASELDGTVTDDSGQPLSEVTVELTGQDVVYDESTWTGGDGTYAFTGLPAGTYLVCFHGRFATPRDASGRGRDDQCYRDVWTTPDAIGPAPGSTPVVVAAGAQVHGIDAQLHPLTEITGRVTDAQGRPVANVSVQLDGVEEQVTSWFDGTYALEAVPAGTHTICFDGTSGQGANNAQGYASMCWHRQPFGSPSPLTLPAHQNVVVDAKLARLPHG